VKIVHGLEEIEIVPWYECEDCTQHTTFAGRLSALLLLQRFTNSEAVIAGLRSFIRDKGYSAIRHFHSDEKTLGQVAQMLARGELHLTRRPLDFRLAPARQSQGAAPPGTQSSSEPEPPVRQAAAPPLPPPEEPTFLPNVDPAAIAQVLTQASISGKPFCAE